MKYLTCEQSRGFSIAVKEYINELSRRHEYLYAAASLLIVTSLVYGVIVFFGFSLSAATYNPGVTSSGPYSYEGRRIGMLPVVDPAAEGYQTLPLKKLVMQYILRGKLPLWNPYLAAGTPLAADTSFSAYAPLQFLSFLPNQLWDLLTLTNFWLAGFFMFIFLRGLKLSKHSAFAGAVFYMLSGSFTLYPNMSWINVIVFTPLLLFYTEKLAQRACIEYITLTSIVVAICILGGFLEVIALQLTLAVLYLLFRTFEARREHFWKAPVAFTSSLILGFGLSAFFTIPILEYISYSFNAHSTGIGLAAAPALIAITYFIPYFIGGVQSYWTEAFRATGNPWDIVTGYVGVTCLFLLSLGVISLFNKKCKIENKRLVIFFMIAGIVALLKTFGAPLVNWVGYLPVLDRVLFPRYSGTIWVFCFAATAAYGVEALTSHQTRLKHVLMASAVTILTVIFLVSFNIPFFVDVASIAYYYPSWRLLEGFLFLFAITMCSTKICQKQDSSQFLGLASIIILEMSLHIPLALPYSFEACRSLFILSMTLCLAGWILTSDIHFTFSLRGVRVSRTVIMIFILSVALFGQMIIAATSPFGLPRQYDAFKTAPYLQFLGENAGFSRVYSLDGVLAPNFAGVFGLYHIGIMSGININSFHSFVLNNLDSRSVTPMFTGAFRLPGTSSVDELRTNERFYSFLGVKYVVTNGTDLSHMFQLVYSDGIANIYENPNVFPRAFIVHRYQVASSFEEAQDILKNPNFNLREKVILEGSLPEIGVNALEQTPLADSSTAKIECYEPDRVFIKAFAEHPEILILTDTFYPGWEAHVDGVPTTIYRVDGLVRAVYLSKGEHTVEFIYFPESFKIGLTISVISAITLIMLLLIDKFKLQKYA